MSFLDYDLSFCQNAKKGGDNEIPMLRITYSSHELNLGCQTSFYFQSKLICFIQNIIVVQTIILQTMNFRPTHCLKDIR